MGAEAIIYLKADGRSLVARVYGEHIYKPGEPFAIHLNPEQVHLFDAETGSVIEEQ
jgi:ABC-type sugar transport system ATPase subunit